MSNQRICIFGEVLFDHFPDGKSVLGGAPFNVAWHLQAFGQAPFFISRIGRDPEGEAVRKAMEEWGMDVSGLQTDNERPTGRVSISFVDAEPVYDIVADCAYDAVEATASEELCRFLYHGSLALRQDRSCDSLKQLRSDRPGTVFMDVNLRNPWWQREFVLELVQQSDWVKLNSDELALLQGSEAGTKPSPDDFLEEYALKGLLLTHGDRGAEVLTDQGEHYRVQPEIKSEVVDTVGAGDAFASVMILGLIQAWPLQLTLQRAQAFASGLVGHRGATVDNMRFYQPYIDNWNLKV